MILIDKDEVFGFESAIGLRRFLITNSLHLKKEEAYKMDILYNMSLTKQGRTILYVIVDYLYHENKIFYHLPHNTKRYSIDLNDYDQIAIEPLRPTHEEIETETDIPSLIQAISYMNQQISIPQSVYVTEECSELIKTFTKRERGKGPESDIIEEACDVLATTFVLLYELGVSKDKVRSAITKKYKRQLDRYYDHGET